MLNRPETWWARPSNSIVNTFGRRSPRSRLGLVSSYLFVRYLVSSKIKAITSTGKMLTAKLSTKGQLVVPKAVRDHLHLNAGDRLDFIIRDDGEVVIRPAVVDVRDLKGLLHEPGRAIVSLAEMQRVVRDRGAGEASGQKRPPRKRRPAMRPSRQTKARR